MPAPTSLSATLREQGFRLTFRRFGPEAVEAALLSSLGTAVLLASTGKPVNGTAASEPEAVGLLCKAMRNQTLSICRPDGAPRCVRVGALVDDFLTDGGFR